MIIYIAQVVFFISILGVLVIILRKIPVLLRYPRHPFEEISFNAFLQRLKNRIISNEIFHNGILPTTEKILRKIKVLVLKLDNFLANLVNGLRHRRKNIEQEIKNGSNDNNDSDLEV